MYLDHIRLSTPAAFCTQQLSHTLIEVIINDLHLLSAQRVVYAEG